MTPTEIETEKNVYVNSLYRRSLRAGVITLSSQGVLTLVHITSTVILARLLSPADYGVIAMVAAITSFAGLFRDLGLSTAAVQKAKLTHGQQSNLFWLNVAAGSALTLMVVLASPLIAWFYQRPELQAVAATISLNFLISSLGTQHGAILTRNMNFGKKAIANIAGSVISLAVAISLATLGYSYWALAISTLTGNFSTTCLLVTLSPFRPGLPRRNQGVSAMVKFGMHVTGFDLANYLHRNLDNILLGKFWGSEILGVYTRAYALLTFPLQAIRGPINAVAFPALSRLQDNPVEYRKYYKTCVTFIAVIAMPLVSHLFVSADSLIRVLLGDTWATVVPLYQTLAIGSFIMPLASTRGVVWLSLGMGRIYLSLGVLNAVIVSIGFCVGVQWGAMGICVAYVTSTYITQIPAVVVLTRYTPITVADVLHSLALPAMISLSFATATGTLLSFTTPHTHVLTLVITGTSALAASAVCFTTTGIYKPSAFNLLRESQLPTA